MEFLVAILVLALAAAVCVAVLQRRRTGARPLGRRADSPIGRRSRGFARRDPMAAAVADHARAMDPADVVVAEQRLQAEARQVAAGLHANAHGNGYATGPVAPAPGGAYADPAVVPPGGAYADSALSAAAAEPGSLDEYYDPVTGARTYGHEDPATDPRYRDPKYDGRLAADWVDPREDPRVN